MVESNFANVHEYTVSELAGAVKRTIEDGFSFVRVRGELGRVTRAGSGHVYLDLKDDKAVLSSVIWKGNAERIRFAPEQGMEVIATGRMTTFPGQSRYQLVIDSLEPAGVGALMALFEERKKKLAAEGLFAPERKRPLPFLPEVIGVVTSPSGAVIRDILHRLRDRFPRHVIVWPTLVQGKGAEAQIAAAINGFNALPEGGDIPRPDVLIVARGGGSLEDLWCFNEELVARAAAASKIPLISAVGHETDTTLIDFVADRRAPTPTAAAEIAVPVRTELLAEVINKERRLMNALSRAAETRRTALMAASRARQAGRYCGPVGAAS
ncbi:MAG: exodeoxyribonuclease VII large subunit [Caulobacterales bacterium]|nr:exodeoxyribonuclease VII large subunit [Caulobacterales bacterium]